jgi:hypothetical protein
MPVLKKTTLSAQQLKKTEGQEKIAGYQRKKCLSCQGLCAVRKNLPGKFVAGKEYPNDRR